MKLEEKLVKERGWNEFSVYPLYSPQRLIAEGSANYGIDLAFPERSKAGNERDILMPIAEIPVPYDARYWQLLNAIKRASRTEESRVGKEWDGTCRSRGSQDH